MSIDLTQVIIALIGLAGTIITSVAVALINKYVKDTAARDQLASAVKNAVGAIEQAGTAEAQLLKPHVEIPGIPQSLVPGVQYVLDHAGEAADRFSISNQKIADKIVAQIGLSNIVNAPTTVVVPSSQPS